MATSISHSPAQTEALGEAWGRVAPPGLVIGLSGDLGAGKTQLVRGLARGLGITARVHSPTFALVNLYPGGRLPLYHLDLYRLDTRAQVLAAGLEDYLRPDGLTVIEWAERLFQLDSRAAFTAPQPKEWNWTRELGALGVAGPFRWVEILAVNTTERRIDYEDIGA